MQACIQYLYVSPNRGFTKAMVQAIALDPWYSLDYSVGYS